MPFFVTSNFIVSVSALPIADDNSNRTNTSEKLERVTEKRKNAKRVLLFLYARVLCSVVYNALCFYASVLCCEVCNVVSVVCLY